LIYGSFIHKIIDINGSCRVSLPSSRTSGIWDYSHGLDDDDFRADYFAARVVTYAGYSSSYQNRLVIVSSDRASCDRRKARATEVNARIKCNPIEKIIETMTSKAVVDFKIGLSGQKKALWI